MGNKNDFQIMCLSNILGLSVPDEGYSRKLYISVFFWIMIDFLYKYRNSNNMFFLDKSREKKCSAES